MEVNLFRRCMTAILDGMIAGTLVYFDDAPIVVREWIFANIQPVVRARFRDNLPAALRRGQFYDGFEEIHMQEAIKCSKYVELLSTIATEIERPESSLPSRLVSLRLKVCSGNLNIFLTNRSIEPSDMSGNDAVVCRLIAACRNLRRLDLYIHKDLCRYCENDRWSIIDNRLGPITKAIRTERVDRAPLEQLTLQYNSAWDFGVDFSICDSLQVLKLRLCYLLSDDWLQLLRRCSRTLQSLTLDGCDFWGGIPDENVELLALNSLNISATNWYDDVRCLLSAETFGRVHDGRVCLFGQFKPGCLKRIRRCLSPEMEVADCIKDLWDIAGVSSAHQLFGQRLVELCINSVECFSDKSELDVVVDALKSIRVLKMDGDSYRSLDRECDDGFPLRFLSNTDRCAKLRRLQIYCRLKRETIRLVFRHCYNLEFLFLVEGETHFGTPEITDDDLTIWARNGAKPKEVYLGFRPTFTVDGVSKLLRSCGDDLKSSFFDERRQFVKMNKKLIDDKLSELSW